MQRTEKQDIYTRITNQIVSHLEKGVRPWVRPWNAEHAAGRITRPLRHNGKPYSGIRLPLYPKLRIQLISEFSSELIRSVMAGDLNLALVTAPPENSQITAVALAQTPLCAALPVTHAAAEKKSIDLLDLAKDEWILFARRVHPTVHDAIRNAAAREGIAPKCAHDIITVQQAVHLVSEHVGVAILAQPPAASFSANRVVVKPISDTSLCFKTCVIMRADDDWRCPPDCYTVNSTMPYRSVVAAGFSLTRM